MRGESEWREQIVLRGEVGRRVLTCACTMLPGDEDSPAGYIVVFDDITALLQAQRDAAWGAIRPAARSRSASVTYRERDVPREANSALFLTFAI